jgi:hypothetical protein
MEMIKMKFNKIIQQNKKKKSIKEKLQDILHKTLYYVIGITLIKIEEIMKNNRNKRWLNNEFKYKKKVLNEMIKYIVKDMIYDNTNVYYIYNSIRYDQIDYSNAIYIKEFLRYGVSRKYSRNARIFREIFMKNGKDEEKYATLFYNLLEEHFKTFDDIEVKRDVNDKWHGSHEYIHLTLNK